MGQQQLLLIVLGVIIVGIAIVVGINLFNSNAESSTKDSITSEAMNLGAMAQQYYQKPVAMGGGGNVFSAKNGGTGWTIPTAMQTSTDADFEGTAPVVTDTSVVITGTPLNKSYTWKVVTTVTPTNISTVVK